MRARPRLLVLALVLHGASGAALAQYKVVRPDGSITYTDRPPVAENNVRITPLSRSAQDAAAARDVQLPAELRQASQRYPVMLYTSADCSPCDAGRRLLQERGIPYGERRVASDDDTLALERVSGGRTVPALTIGAQQLRGYSDADWNGFLDAAGYPKTSKLPRNWPPAQVLPLVERNPASTAPSTPVVDPRPNDPPATPSSGIRF